MFTTILPHHTFYSALEEKESENNYRVWWQLCVSWCSERDVSLGEEILQDTSQKLVKRNPRAGGKDLSQQCMSSHNLIVHISQSYTKDISEKEKKVSD